LPYQALGDSRTRKHELAGKNEPGNFDPLVRHARGRGQLARIRQAGGKYVEAFALEGELDPAAIRSNEFEIEWPPRSGRFERFPEVVEARWMTLAEARELMLPSQLPLLDALEEKLKG
jgi:predicted NUDIX family NTP pyrophosphohydrolase